MDKDALCAYSGTLFNHGKEGASPLQQTAWEGLECITLSEVSPTDKDQ